jgi:hypothetical protein
MKHEADEEPHEQRDLDLKSQTSGARTNDEDEDAKTRPKPAKIARATRKGKQIAEESLSKTSASHGEPQKKQPKRQAKSHKT